MEKINDGLTPQERYHKKVGWVSKSYKLKQADIDAFAKACEKAGVSQAGQLTKMMREFAEKIEAEK